MKLSIKKTILVPPHVIANNILRWNIHKEYDDKTFNMDINIMSRLQYTIITQLRSEHIK